MSSRRSPRNVALLLSDEHNPFYSSPYGDSRIDTPHMQRMADQGTLFENAYCPSPLCLPCRAAFTAGRHVHQVQAYNNSNVNLSDRFESWGAALDSQNVHSVMVGKVDAFAHSSKLGFSETIVPGDRNFPGDTNISRRPMKPRPGAADRSSEYGPRDDPHPHDDCVVDRAIQWLETRAPTLDKPFVLAINILAPHFPHYCRPELWEKYKDAEDLPLRGTDQASAQHPRAIESRLHFQTDSFPESDVKGLRRGYYACIDYVDQQLGRIMETLNRMGLDDSTNLIYASDHGEMLGQFGMWWKCSLYEHSARIPILALGPDFQGGKRIKTPANLLDVQAEFFRSTNAAMPADGAGVPLQDLPEDDSSAVAFSEYHGHAASDSAFMIRQGPWKLIYHINAPHQLFNLDEDPEELENRFESEGSIAAKLEGELRKICDPERESERADAFVAAQWDAIQRDNLPFEIYNQNISD